MRRKIIPKTFPRSALAVVSAGAQDRNSSGFSSCQKKECPNCRRSSSFKKKTVERQLVGSAKTKVDAQFELVFAAGVAQTQHQSNVPSAIRPKRNIRDTSPPAPVLFTFDKSPCWLRNDHGRNDSHHARPKGDRQTGIARETGIALA